jgi:hypothetical protein
MLIINAIMQLASVKAKELLRLKQQKGPVFVITQSSKDLSSMLSKN